MRATTVARQISCSRAGGATRLVSRESRCDSRQFGDQLVSRGHASHHLDAVISDRLIKRKLWQRGVACCMRATLCVCACERCYASKFARGTKNVGRRTLNRVKFPRLTRRRSCERFFLRALHFGHASRKIVPVFRNYNPTRADPSVESCFLPITPHTFANDPTVASRESSSRIVEFASLREATFPVQLVRHLRPPARRLPRSRESGKTRGGNKRNKKGTRARK